MEEISTWNDKKAIFGQKKSWLEISRIKCSITMSHIITHCHDSAGFFVLHQLNTSEWTKCQIEKQRSRNIFHAAITAE